MSTYPQKGFSLVELLIVVAIIIILASIAIPNLMASRRAANESSAQSALRTIHAAQGTYQSTKGNGTFADTLAKLGGESLIDSVLAVADGTARSGYNYDIHDVSGSGPVALFAAKAIPSVTSGLGQTGDRRYGITEVGVLRGDTNITVDPNTRNLILGMAAFNP